MACEQRALELAAAYLARRDRTVDEVRRHLAGRDVGEREATAAIAELRRLGYLDDARYARAFADDRRALDGWGSERIARRLLALGIDGELVADVVGARDAAAELRAALDVLRRRCRSAPAGERERERALALLLRRGYEPELALDAVRAFEREAVSDAGAPSGAR